MYSNDINAEVKWSVPHGIISMILGCFAVYGILLGTGQFIYCDGFGGELMRIQKL